MKKFILDLIKILFLDFFVLEISIPKEKPSDINEHLETLSKYRIKL